MSEFGELQRSHATLQADYVGQDKRLTEALGRVEAAEQLTNTQHAELQLAAEKVQALEGEVTQARLERAASKEALQRICTQRQAAFNDRLAEVSRLSRQAGAIGESNSPSGQRLSLRLDSPPGRLPPLGSPVRLDFPEAAEEVDDDEEEEAAAEEQPAGGGGGWLLRELLNGAGSGEWRMLGSRGSSRSGRGGGSRRGSSSVHTRIEEGGFTSGSASNGGTTSSGTRTGSAATTPGESMSTTPNPGLSRRSSVAESVAESSDEDDEQPEEAAAGSEGGATRQYLEGKARSPRRMMDETQFLEAKANLDLLRGEFDLSSLDRSSAAAPRLTARPTPRVSREVVTLA